ncbi:MAG TPA: DUF6293 family protein [Methanocorpusculum sp.]|nr:DUF6293 family protein [Methanocorpusculum sp.]
MAKRLRETVHIIPLSGNEKRAASVFETNTADRVHLIVRKKDAAWKNFSAFLLEKNIDVKTTVCDTANPTEFLSCISGIISAENPAENSVYVNISAAGTLCAGLCTLAGMAQKAAVYSVENGEIVLIPEVDVVLPQERESDVLAELVHAENEVLSASEISDILEGEDCEEEMCIKEESCYSCANLISFSCAEEEMKILSPHAAYRAQKEKRTIQSRNLMKVSSFMRKMEEKGYVEKKKEGRKMLYRVTEKGRYAFYMSGRRG